MACVLNFFYLSLVILAAPWLLASAIRKGKYRDGWRAKLLGQVPRCRGDRMCIWLHAVSVGEANLLQTVLPHLERQYPHAQCVISVTTKAAYELARKKYAPRMVFYCPLDFSWAVKEAFVRIRPDLLVLCELELWPNLIRTAKNHGVRVALINGRLSEKSFRGYRRVRWFMSRLLNLIDVIALQNEEYAERFRALGARPQIIHVTGSLKFDGAQADRNNPTTRKLSELAGIDNRDAVFLAGSTQHPEEEFALTVFQNLSVKHPQLRLILVPRHAERFNDVARLLDRSGVIWQRRTRLDTDGPNPQARVLLVDTIGELGAWWASAHVAYVGGSMGSRGGQNMIEPAAYGAAVSFGPNTHNFRDVVALMMRHQAAQIVRNVDEMQAFVERCLVDTSFANRLGQSAMQLVRRQQGAAQKTAELLREQLERCAAKRDSQRSAA